jgi:cell wall-associated NlpC family hydrolase
MDYKKRFPAKAFRQISNTWLWFGSLFTLAMIAGSCSPAGLPNLRESHVHGVHVYFQKDEWYHKDKPASGQNERQLSDTRKQIIATTKELLGSPYKFGGDSPNEGFDCSGLVQYVYNRHGIKLPRRASHQYQKTNRISPKKARPGDLLFFNINGKGISHVGIYVGRMRFIHAPSSGKKVRTASLKKKYWQKRFRGVHSPF